MMKCLLAMFTAVCAFSSIYAQAGKDTVIVVDKTTVELLQLLHPRFFYSENPALFTENMQKYLLYDLLLCNEQRAVLEQDTALAKRHGQFLQLASVYFWAEEARKHSAQTAPSEEEIRACYEKHTHLFRTPVVFTFYQAWTPGQHKELPGVTKELQRRVKLWQQNKPDNSKIMLGSTALNLESNIAMSTDNPLYTILNSMQPLEIKSLQIEQNQVQLALTEKRGGELIPYEQVREQCIQLLLNERSLQEKEEFRKKMERIDIIDNVKQ